MRFSLKCRGTGYTLPHLGVVLGEEEIETLARDDRRKAKARIGIVEERRKRKEQLEGFVRSQESMVLVGCLRCPCMLAPCVRPAVL